MELVTGSVQPGDPSTDEAGDRNTIITGTVVRGQKLLQCRDCGTRYAPRSYLDHMKRRLGAPEIVHLDRQICPSCARIKRSRNSEVGHSSVHPVNVMALYVSEMFETHSKK